MRCLRTVRRTRVPTDAARSQLFSRLDVLSDPSLSTFFFLNAFPSSSTTPFTTITSTTTADRLQDRPALLVSATSWTADEDFSILLAALSIYDVAAKTLASGAGGLKGSDQGSRLPKVLVVITGKGAGKAAFEEQVRHREQDGGWEHVRVRTAWLAIEDYPKLLGASSSLPASPRSRLDANLILQARQIWESHSTRARLERISR